MVVWEALEAACSNDNCKIYCSDNYYGNIVWEPSIIVNHGIISRNRLKKHNTSKYEFQTFFPSKKHFPSVDIRKTQEFFWGRSDETIPHVSSPSKLYDIDYNLTVVPPTNVDG